MTITVRLDRETERLLARLSRALGKTRSEVVRDAIRRLGSVPLEDAGAPTAYERFADVIGIVNRGRGNRAARSEEILREMFRTRRRRGG